MKSTLPPKSGKRPIKAKGIYVRVSEPERDQIRQNAKRKGISFSDYVREAALGSHV